MRAMLCRHGVAILPDPQPCREGAVKAVEHEGTAGQTAHLLPNPAFDDVTLSDQVPITITIDATDLADFGRGSAVAATFFGPESLAADKIQNEDFALAGVIETDDGGYPFGIVADGVTAKTFWSVRGSRIAAFAAYEALKRAICDGWRPEKGEATEIDPLIQKLAETIERRFGEDRSALLAAGAVPSKWDAAVFQQHAAKEHLWHQPPLLPVVLGPEGGRFLYDGVC